MSEFDRRRDNTYNSSTFALSPMQALSIYGCFTNNKNFIFNISHHSEAKFLRAIRFNSESSLMNFIPWSKCKLHTNKFQEFSNRTNKDFIRARSIVCHSVFAFRSTYKCIEATIWYSKSFSVPLYNKNFILILFLTLRITSEAELSR